jgi:hypothetical protein
MGMNDAMLTSADVLPAASAPPTHRARLAHRIVTGLFVAGSLYSVWLLLSGAPALLAEAQVLGYPSYFTRMLGVAKLLGSAALVLPNRPSLREWAYAGFVFEFSAAIVSRLAAGEPASMAIPAMVELVFVGISYALWRRVRADGRRPVVAS